MDLPVDINELLRREDETVEWKENVASVEQVARKLTAFANNYSGMADGGWVVCGVAEEKDEHGFPRPRLVGLTDDKLKEVRGKVLNWCRERIHPPLHPQVYEVPTEDPSRRVLVFYVAASQHAHSLRTDEGEYFWISYDSETRQARGQLLRELLRRKEELPPFVERPCTMATLDDIDNVSASEFLRQVGLPRPPSEYLKPDVGIDEIARPLVASERIAPETFRPVPTYLSLLLFSLHPTRFIPGAYVVFSVYEGVSLAGEHSQRSTVAGPIPKLIQDLMGALQFYTGHSIDKSASIMYARQNRERYSDSALREALINALAHRDYESQDPTRVTIFSDRIEIHNPGGYYGNLDPEQLKAGYLKSTWRNVPLARFLERMSLVQHEGQGIPTIIRETSRVTDGDKPEIRPTPDSFTVVIPSFQPTLIPGRSVDEVREESGKIVYSMSRKLSNARRWTLTLGVALFITLFTLAYTYLTSWYPWKSEPRPVVAVLNFENRTEGTDDAWLSLAVADLLRTYVSLGDEVRTVSGKWTMEVERDLSRGPLETLSVAECRQLQDNLDVDVLVGGWYERADTSSIRFILKIVGADGQLREIASRTRVIKSPGAFVYLLGDPLRQELNIPPLTILQRQAVADSFPEQTEAGKLYSEGLERLWRYDYAGARDLLEQAVMIEAHPMLNASLAEAWLELKYPENAVSSLESAVKLADRLPDELRRSVETRLYEVAGDWHQVVMLLTSIYETFPDDFDVGLRLATAQINEGNSDETLATLTSLGKLPVANKNPRLTLVRAWYWELRGDLRQAIADSRLAAQQAEEAGIDHLAAEALLTEAGDLIRLDETVTAVEVLDEAISRFEEMDNLGKLGAAYELKGEALHWTDLEAAKESYVSACETYRGGGNRKGEAWALMQLGNMLFEMEQSTEARSYIEQAMVIFTELNAREDKAAALVNIGAFDHMQGKLSEARDEYTEALTVFQDLGDELNTAVALTNLGEIYYAEGRFDRAQQYHEEARAVNQRMAEDAGAAYDSYRLGKVFFAQGRWEDARSSYRQALEVQEKLAIQVDILQTRLAVAELELSAKNFESATELARKALTEAQEGGLDEQAALARALVACARLELGQEADVGGALTSLAIAEWAASEEGRLLDAFEVRLVSGKIELLAGQTDARIHLTELRNEAKDRGILVFVQRVDELLDRAAPGGVR